MEAKESSGSLYLKYNRDLFATSASQSPSPAEGRVLTRAARVTAGVRTSENTQGHAQSRIPESSQRPCLEDDG